MLKTGGLKTFQNVKNPNATRILTRTAVNPWREYTNLNDLIVNCRTQRLKTVYCFGNEPMLMLKEKFKLINSLSYPCKQQSKHQFQFRKVTMM